MGRRRGMCGWIKCEPRVSLRRLKPLDAPQWSPPQNGEIHIAGSCSGTLFEQARANVRKEIRRAIFNLNGSIVFEKEKRGRGAIATTRLYPSCSRLSRRGQPPPHIAGGSKRKATR